MVTYYPGVWDLLHIGHINAIKQAIKYEPNSNLVIGICSDNLNYKLKNKHCIFNEIERQNIIQNIRGVDKTIIYDSVDYQIIIECLKINNPIVHFACGPDFGKRKDQFDFLTWCEKNNVSIFRTKKTEGISTTDIVDKIISEGVKHAYNSFI